MEDETLIGNLLVLTGIFIILFGFLMLVIGTAIGMRENSRPGKGYSKRKEEFGKEADSTGSFQFEGPENKDPYAGKAESKIRGGGVIMLGPIPIIFGSDKESANTAVILAIILMILSLLVFRNVIF
ncbi:MAG: TIGR00304 family protein [Euryarchaeota archaeon]|nr:TIGR00304 family protein [Euryarchaeota archaeon]